MSFFSSEEHIKEWEQEHPELKGSTISPEQGLGLVLKAADTRGDYNYAPITREDLYQAFEHYGFVGEFWKPRE
jgi:hypothetical protein